MNRAGPDRDRTTLLFMTGCVLVLFWLALGRGSRLNDLQRAANGGDAQSQLKLGKLYAEGRSLPSDKGRALAWFLKSAQQGVTEAQYRVAEIYEVGIGVPTDYDKAVHWYREAAKAKYGPAECALGMAYQVGEGVERDFVEAMKWMQLAFLHGDTNSIQMMSDMSVAMTPNEIEEGKRRAKTADTIQK